MARRSILARVFAWPLAIRLGVLLAILALIGSLTLVTTGLISLGGKPVSLAITPSAALLPSVGATRTLSASTLDASGKASPVTATWTSSHPDVVAIDAAGMITAKTLGSAQITATAAGFTSAPTLVVVAGVAPGVTLVDDSQIVESPLDPGTGSGTVDDTYQARLKGVTPKIGDRLFGTGEQPVAGEVVDAQPSGENTIVTLKLIPLPDLVPDLRINERIPLTDAPVEIVPEVARLYDVVRDGTKFTFTPKANFQQLVEQTPASGSSGPMPGPALAMVGSDVGSSLGTAQLGVGVPVGTRMLPFSECELKSDTVSNEGPRFLPFSLSEGPTFEVEIDPFYEVQWSDTNKHLVLGAAPKVKVTLGLQVDASFSATYECKATLFTFPVPIGGPLSWFISGLVPIGAGFEIGGEVTLASAKASITIEATGTLGIGFDCAEGQGCRLVHELDASLSKPPEWTVKLVPTAADLRFKPSIEAFGFVEANVGNPASRFRIFRFLDRLKLKAAEAKFGPKVELDWAPRAVQIADTRYSSEFKASFELGVEAGADLEGIADRLGLNDILSTGLEKSIDLEGSPKGSVDLSKVQLTAGQPVTVTVGLTENVSMLAIYNVEKVVLVRSTGGTTSALGAETVLATTTATAGQTDFDLTFTPTQDMKVSELHAFVVTKFPPGDLIDFELERSAPASRLVYLRAGADFIAELFTAAPDGSDERKIPFPIGFPKAVAGYWPVGSPDGTRLLLHTSDGPWFLQTDGSTAHKLPLPSGVSAVHFDWSRDGSWVLFAGAVQGSGHGGIWSITPDGGSARELLGEEGVTSAMPSWSPDGSKFAYSRNARGGYEIWVANKDGSGAHKMSGQKDVHDFYPHWSPDGTQIVFTRSIAFIGGQIWVMNADGSNARALTTAGGDVFPQWSPDGSRILFQHSTVERTVLMIMNADGTGAAEVPNSTGGQYPNWLLISR